MTKTLEEVKAGISPIYNDPHFDVLNKDEYKWTHYKHPQTKYIEAGTVEYGFDFPLEDMDEVVYYTTPDDDHGIVSVKDPNYEKILLNPDMHFKFSGKIQTSKPLGIYHLLIMYVQDKSRLIWFRNISEFLDGRFVRVLECEPKKQADAP